MDTIKSMFTPLLKENSMKHIDYKTFNSIQAVANPAVESRYGTLQSKVAELVRKHCEGREERGERLQFLPFTALRRRRGDSSDHLHHPLLCRLLLHH